MICIDFLDQSNKYFPHCNRTSRLRKFRISIHLFNEDATSLAKKLASGKLVKEGLSPSQQFDRVEVNNMVDREYVGRIDTRT